jgi:hypothetical protein
MNLQESAATAIVKLVLSVSRNFTHKTASWRDYNGIDVAPSMFS